MQYVYPHCVVAVDEELRYVETRFADGSKVGSTPNADEHTMRVAEELGYGTDTWAMSRDHELSHAWLAHCDGAAWSPTMWRLAHPDGDDLPDDAEVAREEERVLEYQVSLDKGAPRPWDVAGVPVKAAGLPW